jgi:electron-transferring-flavoprotein dehydrogenase
MSSAKQHSWQAADVEREALEVDVLLVGAGPASLACAIHLKRLLAAKGMDDKTVLVLESGAVMDPRGMAELFPDWRERGCPIEADVSSDALEILLNKGRGARLGGPFLPPTLRNHGNCIVSLYHVVRWLAAQAESSGVEVYSGFAGAEVLYEGDRVVGVQTRDAGLAKSGARKSNFEPGMNVRAAVTVFGEGTRGNLAKDLIARLRLASSDNPQMYAAGIKELWEIPPERGQALRGTVIHTVGHPIGTDGYGGGWIYGLAENRLSIGYVIGLDHHDARLDPHALFVQWKGHPRVAAHLQGGKVLRYGAKTIPEGGYFAMPTLQGDGFCLVGDTAGFVNMARLKGIHLAIKSGLLAAEAIAEALERNDTSGQGLSGYTRRFEESWAKRELWAFRNFRQAFDSGFVAGVLDAGVQLVTGGRGVMKRRKGHADHSTTRPIGSSRMQKPAYNDRDAFDKLTDVYWSGTVHEEDQPPHLLITDPDICVRRCTQEFGNPCQHFCPAAVYEWLPEEEVKGVRINASNCVHCKTCDIADPYQIIQWVVPEGGGGPKYIDM